MACDDIERASGSVCERCSLRLSILAGVQLQSRLFTALNLLPTPGWVWRGVRGFSHSLGQDQTLVTGSHREVCKTLLPSEGTHLLVPKPPDQFASPAHRAWAAKMHRLKPSAQAA